MSRASSQQRIYDQDQVVSESPTDWRQQRSLSRNDSQRSLTEYQQQMRQPDQLITTRIDESGILDTRKPSVSFRNNEYEQQPQNLQQMVEQRSPVYDNGGLQQQYQEPYNQSYQQPGYQDEYSYGSNPQYNNYEQSEQNMGQGYNYEQQPEQYVSANYNAPQYEQQRPYVSESRRQSPDKDIPYQQPPRQGYQSESRRQSPEQEYQSTYVEPETPKRSTPPKRDTPPRQQSSDDINKSLQQRQQSRDQLYGREKTESPEETARSPNGQQRQQSRENVQEKSSTPGSSTPSSQTISPAPPKGTAKSMAPTSPTRNRKPSSSKGGAEQKESRNTVGEASRAGRKPDAVQKQPPKTVTSIRGKK